MNSFEIEKYDTHERVVLFGAFEADLAARELRKRGVKVKLPEQSFRVLEVLVEEPGRIVSREELRTRLWPPDTHVEFEANLNTVVHTLRAALGDAAKNPRFIDTVHGRGYRFLAPVSRGEASEPRRHPGIPRILHKAALTAAVGAAALLIGWNLGNEGPLADSRAIAAPNAVPITSYVGAEAGPSFSPDGTSIAFHWDGGDHDSFDIYVKGEEAHDPRRLTDDPSDERNPVWSPDGREIAFVRTLPGYKADLMSIPSAGGAARTIATIPTSDTRLSWSPDGRWLAYSVTYPDYLRHESAEAGILAVEVSTGRAVSLTNPGPLTHGDSFPAISPDGRQLAFVRGVSESTGDVFIVDIDAKMQTQGAPRQITSDAAIARSPVWSADGETIFFVSNRSGTPAIWRISLAEQARNPVPVGTHRVLDFAVSPDGGRLYFSNPSESQNLRRVVLDDSNRATEAVLRLTHSTRINRGPALSPDGRFVAFQSDRSGANEIWIADSDGAHPRQISSFGGPASGSPYWSPDGSRIVADSRVGGTGDIFVLDPAGGPARRLTNQPSDDIVPSWSRDGRWIYFASNRTGRYEVWRMPSDGGEAKQVTRNGGFRAIESLDGKTLYFAKSTSRTSLWKTAPAGGEESLVVESLGDWANFSPTNGGVYFSQIPVQRTTAISFFDESTAQTHHIVTVEASLDGGLTATEDGRAFVFSMPDTSESDLLALMLR